MNSYYMIQKLKNGLYQIILTTQNAFSPDYQSFVYQTKFKWMAIRKYKKLIVKRENEIRKNNEEILGNRIDKIILTEKNL